MLRARGRFYGAALIGFVVWLATWGQHEMLRVLLAADVFFALFVIQTLAVSLRLSSGELRERAQRAARGGTRVMVLLAAGAVVVSLVAIFTLLNHPRTEGRFFPVVAVLSVPLSWAMMHTIAGLSYARLYYTATGWGAPEGGLAFPEGGEPSAMDFVYYAFVIGTSASVSDVNTTSHALRMATLVHSLSSFVFNTVLLAIAVNAAMTFAG